MSDFETSAELSITVPQRELRQARQEIEDGIGSVSVSVENGRAMRPDGGISGASLAGASAIDELGDQTQLLEGILDELEDGSGGGGSGLGGGGGGGGGGSGLLSGLGLGAGIRAGGSLGGLGLGALASGTGLLGAFGLTATALPLAGLFANRADPSNRADFDEFRVNGPRTDPQPSIDPLPGSQSTFMTPGMPVDTTTGFGPDLDSAFEQEYGVDVGNVENAWRGAFAEGITGYGGQTIASDRIFSNHGGSSGSTSVDVTNDITVDGGSPSQTQLEQMKAEMQRVAEQILSDSGADVVSQDLQRGFTGTF